MSRAIGRAPSLWLFPALHWLLALDKIWYCPSPLVSLDFPPAFTPAGAPSMIHWARRGHEDRQYLRHSSESAPGSLPEGRTRITTHSADFPIILSQKELIQYHSETRPDRPLIKWKFSQTIVSTCWLTLITWKFFWRLFLNWTKVWSVSSLPAALERTHCNIKECIYIYIYIYSRFLNNL